VPDPYVIFIPDTVLTPFVKSLGNKYNRDGQHKLQRRMGAERLERALTIPDVLGLNYFRTRIPYGKTLAQTPNPHRLFTTFPPEESAWTSTPPTATPGTGTRDEWMGLLSIYLDNNGASLP